MGGLDKSKARIFIIDLVEDLLNKGVKTDDFVGWAAIIKKAGVSVVDLAESLAEYSTIHALSNNRERQPEEIRTEVTGLEAQVLALTQERDGAHQAIIADKDKALKEVKAAEGQAKQHVDSLLHDATNYGHLKKEAEFLEDRGHGVHFSNLACKVPSSLDSVHGFRLSTVPKTVSITLGLFRVTPVTSRSRPQAVPHRLFVTPRRPALFRPDAPASFMRLPIGNNPRCRRSERRRLLSWGTGQKKAVSFQERGFQQSASENALRGIWPRFPWASRRR